MSKEVETKRNLVETQENPSKQVETIRELLQTEKEPSKDLKEEFEIYEFDFMPYVEYPKEPSNWHKFKVWIRSLFQ